MSSDYLIFLIFFIKYGEFETVRIESGALRVSLQGIVNESSAFIVCGDDSVFRTDHFTVGDDGRGVLAVFAEFFDLVFGFDPHVFAL